MDEDFLKFGDKILLYSDSAFAYLTTMGFNSPELFGQQSAKLHESNMPNISSMVFEIVPKLGYDSMRELRRENKQLKQRELNQQSRSEHIKGSEQDVLKQQEKQMMLQKRIDQQTIANNRWIKKLEGKKVTYGSPIQLKHVESQMFLQYNKKTAILDRSCQSIELINDPSAQRVTFYIQQRYKYRQDGEAVVYNDHILLYNQKYNCYIHLSEDQLQEQVKMNLKPSKYRPKSPLRRCNPQEIFKKLEVNCSQNFYKWQVLSYRQVHHPNDIKNYIFSGNVIRMKHAETSGFLCYDEISTRKPGKNVYVRIYKGMDENDKYTTNNLFYIEKHHETRNQKAQNNGIALPWDQDGQTQTCYVRLRHLNSGKLLQVKVVDKKPNQKGKGKKQLVLTLADNISADEVNYRIDKIKDIEYQNRYNTDFNPTQNEEIIRLTRGVKDDQIFQIQNSIVDVEPKVKNLSVVKIVNLLYGVTISTEIKKLEGDEAMEEEDEEGEGQIADDISQVGTELPISEVDENSIYPHANKEEEEEEHVVDENKFTPMMYDESDQMIINMTKLVKASSMDDVFIMDRVEDIEVESILFIQSCVPKIKEFIYNMRYFNSELTSPYMKEFEELLIMLVFFVISTDSKEPFTCEGYPNKKHQKYLREIKIIDLLVDILIYPFEGDPPYLILDNLTQRSPMTRVCQLIYRLIKHTVKENEFNKFYAAQWISHFFHQSMMTTDKNNLMADSTTTEILNNNKQLLDRQINNQVIRNIVENCANSVKNERFLNLMCNLCSCNGEAIQTNQDGICDLLLEEDEFSSILINIITQVEGVKKVHYAEIHEEKGENGGPLLIEVEKMYAYFKEKHDLTLFNYFESMINLVSLMCMQRNYAGIKPLELKYTLEFTIDCFLNENIPKKLRANLAKLLISLHIDKDPLEQVNLPILTRVWQEIQQKLTQIEQSLVPINVMLLKLKEFVKEFFISMKGIQRSFENDLNILTLQVLNILHKMILLGFYTNEQEIVDVINPVIDLLDGSNDFTSKDEEDAYNAFQAKLEDQGDLKKRRPEENSFKRDKRLRYRSNENNSVIFSIKKKIIEILHKVIDIQNDIRLSKFLGEFYTSDNNLMIQPTQSGKELIYLNNVLSGKPAEKEEETTAIKQKCDDKVINWMRKSYANRSVDMRTQSQKDIICILLDIILYQDPAMVNSAFTLLARYFSQKRSIINYANDVQLLQDEQEVTILKKVSVELREMKKEAENSEFWMGKPTTDKLKKAQLFIQKLEMLTDLCIDFPNRVIEFDVKKKKKKDDDEDQNEDMEFLNLSELLQEWDNEDSKVTDDDEKNDQKNQRLLSNLFAHEIPIIIIRTKGLEQADDKNSYLRVLEKAYIFLIKFVRNNKKNQLLLVEHVELFMDDMEFGVHAWELICEVFRNSDQLLTYNLTPIIKKAIKIIDHLPKEIQKKTTLLSFLIYFMTDKQNPIKDNQYLICSEITSSVRKNSDHLFVGMQGLKDLHLYMLEMKSQYAEFMGDEKFLQEIQIPPELCYTMEYIKLLGVCGEGKNSMTEAIASDKLPLHDLIKNMEMADFCYPLKASLVYFMDSIYFDIEKDVSDENVSKMQKVIQIIYTDIEKFLEIQQRVKSNKIQPSGKRIQNVENLENEDLEAIYVDINKNFNMQTPFGSYSILYLMEKYMYETVYPALEHFLELRLPIKPNQKEFYKKLLQIMQKSVSYSKKELHFENAKNLFKTIKKIPQLKEFGGDNMSNKQLTQWVLNSADKGSGSANNEMDLMLGIPNLSSAQKLRAYLLSVQSSDTLINEFEKEFEEIVIYIIQIKTKTEKAFGGTNTLDVKELIQSLITVSDIDTDIESNLRIICLKVIRKVIELENKTLTTPASQWETEDWSMFRDEIVEQQNMLISLEVIRLLCNLIAYEQKRTIKEEALLVAIACLLGGNPHCQQKFNQYIMQDAPNQFILSLKEMLFEAFEAMKKTQIKRNELKLKYEQIEQRIQELQSNEFMTKSLKVELVKCNEQQKVLIEDIQSTDYQDDENPAMYTTNELTVRRSIENSYTILRFIQLLCENHNINCQNQLRQQVSEDGKPKGTSFDLCTYLSKSLEQFQNLFNDQTFDVCNQLVDALIEMIQGPCKLNQKALVNSKIIDSSREYIAGFEKKEELHYLGFESDEDIDNIGGYKYKLVTLLTSLMEGEIDMEIINRMAFSLDFGMMKNRMLKVFSRFAEKLLNKENLIIKDIPQVKLDTRLQKESFDESVAEAFEIFILIHSLADTIKIAEEHLQKSKFTPDQWKAFDYIRSHTCRIEINMNNHLQRVYFTRKPICNYISVQAKKQLMIDVDRESQQTKVKDLVQAVPDLIDEMYHNEALTRATLEITPDRLRALKDFSTVIGILINVIFLFSSRKFHYRETDIEDWVIDSIDILGYIQGTSSLILIFFFAINKKELITKKKWRHYISQNQSKYELLPNDDRLEVSEMSFEMTHQILMLKGPLAPEFNFEDTVNFGNIFTWSEYQILTFYFFIQDTTFQYYVFYFGISMLGKYSLSIYYSFHLLDVVNRSAVLQNVMKAITQNIEQVGLTGILMMILVYIYTSLTFFYIQDGMYDYSINAYDSDVVGENECLTMFQCYVTEIDKGMRYGGGIGDMTEPVHYNDEMEKYLFKLVHDSSFQIVINIICLNIIFGIIVNAFATLRDQKSKNDEDMHNVCYICNLERLIFDKNAEGGFQLHIEKDHNLWQYVFYIVHLNTKDKSDHNGLESYVFQKLMDQDYSWIPRQKALCLQNAHESNDEEEQQEKMRQVLQSWQTRINDCIKTFDEIQEKIQKKEKEAEEKANPTKPRKDAAKKP